MSKSVVNVPSRPNNLAQLNSETEVHLDDEIGNNAHPSSIPDEASKLALTIKNEVSASIPSSPNVTTTSDISSNTTYLNKSPGRGSLQHRLIDYVCFVGLNGKDSEKSIQSSRTASNRNKGGTSRNNRVEQQNDESVDDVQLHNWRTPKMLRRFPPYDHKDFALPLDMVSFCQPEGCFVWDDRHQEVNKNSQISSSHGPFHEEWNKYFPFMLTDKDSGSVHYGFTLNFYRRIEKKRRQQSNRPRTPRKSCCSDQDNNNDSEDVDQSFSVESKESTNHNNLDSDRHDENSVSERVVDWPRKRIPLSRIRQLSMINKGILRTQQKRQSKKKDKFEKLTNARRRRMYLKTALHVIESQRTEKLAGVAKIGAKRTESSIGNLCPSPTPSHLLNDSGRSGDLALAGQDKTTSRTLYSLTSICIISRHPFISNVRTCLDDLKSLIDQTLNVVQLNDTNLHHSSLMNSVPSLIESQNSLDHHYNSAHRDRPSHSTNSIWSKLLRTEDIFSRASSALSQSNMRKDDFKDVDCSICLQVEKKVTYIESWIQRLLETPSPIKDGTYLELSTLPTRDSIVPQHFPFALPPNTTSDLASKVTFAFPDKDRFSMANHPIQLPLELLGIDAFITVLTLVLLEKKIVFQSNDYYILSVCIISLIQLIHPLEYVFPVIPLLPISLRGSEQLLFTPTPFLIGIPSNFLSVKSNIKLPDDIWLVNLDEALIYAPNTTNTSSSVTFNKGDQMMHSTLQSAASQQQEQLEAINIPDLPEPEGKNLRHQLKQSLASMPIMLEPVANFDELSPYVLQQLSQAGQSNAAGDSSLHHLGCFIYGNDVESVDIATRVSLVNFMFSPNILKNFEQHLRILRLYPKPVVAFQMRPFILSRPKRSQFTALLGDTQAVQCYAEWITNPDNLVFQKILNKIYDPKIIGDKPRWFLESLEKVKFDVWDIWQNCDHETPSDKNVETIITVEEGLRSRAASNSSLENKTFIEGIRQKVMNLPSKLYPPTVPFQSSSDFNNNNMLVQDLKFEDNFDCNITKLHSIASNRPRNQIDQLIRHGKDVWNDGSDSISEGADDEGEDGDTEITDTFPYATLNNSEETDGSCVNSPRILNEGMESKWEMFNNTSNEQKHDFDSHDALIDSEKVDEKIYHDIVENSDRDANESTKSLTELYKTFSFISLNNIEDNNSVNTEMQTTEASHSSHSVSTSSFNRQSTFSHNKHITANGYIHKARNKLKHPSSTGKKGSREEKEAIDPDIDKSEVTKQMNSEIDEVKCRDVDARTSHASVSNNGDGKQFSSATFPRTTGSTSHNKRLTHGDDRPQAQAASRCVGEITSQDSNYYQMSGNRQKMLLQKSNSSDGKHKFKDGNYHLEESVDLCDSDESFLKSIGSEINFLANHTSNLLGDLFGSHPNIHNLTDNDVRSHGGLEHVGFDSFSNYSRRRDSVVHEIAENSSAIHHPTSRKFQADIKRLGEEMYTSVGASSPTFISQDDHTVIRDVITHISQGSHITWVKQNKFKRLMESETYRIIALNFIDMYIIGGSLINKTDILNCDMSRTQSMIIRGLQDHVEDVVVDRNVWKGLLRCLITMLNGIFVSLHNSTQGLTTSSPGALLFASTKSHHLSSSHPGVGSADFIFANRISSAFKIFELAHTIYYECDADGNPNVVKGSRNTSISSVVTKSRNTSIQSSIAPSTLYDVPTCTQLSSFVDQFEVEQNASEGTTFDDVFMSDNIKHPMSSKTNLTSQNSQNQESVNIAISPTEDDTTGFMKPPFIQPSINEPSSVTDQIPPLVPAKSHNPSGFRFHLGKLVLTSRTLRSPKNSLSNEQQNMKLTEDECTVPQTSRRLYIFQGIRRMQDKMHTNLLPESINGGAVPPPPQSYTGGIWNKRPSGKNNPKNSNMWCNVEFWQNAFYDVVDRERELVGFVSSKKYCQLSSIEDNIHSSSSNNFDERADRKSSVVSGQQEVDQVGPWDARKIKDMEADEDALLATILLNLTAFMLMLRVNHSLIRRVVRRLMAKSHLGLDSSREINNLLDNLEYMKDNDIDLKPPPSLKMNRHTFAVTDVSNGKNSLSKSTSIISTPENQHQPNKLTVPTFESCSKSKTMNDHSTNYTIEVREDGLVIRSTFNPLKLSTALKSTVEQEKRGTVRVLARWTYSVIVNMTYNPKTQIICIWRRQESGQEHCDDDSHPIRSKRLSESSTVSSVSSVSMMTSSSRTNIRSGGQFSTILHKFHAEKCKDLYCCIKESMERAAALYQIRRKSSVGTFNRDLTTKRSVLSSSTRKLFPMNHPNTDIDTMELGGEFPVQDISTSEGGLLQVCIEGVAILFADSEIFIRIDHIRKCFTQDGTIFILEEFDPKTKRFGKRRFNSPMAEQICYSLLCVFSYVAAGEANKTQHLTNKIPTNSKQK